MVTIASNLEFLQSRLLAPEEPPLPEELPPPPMLGGLRVVGVGLAVFLPYRDWMPRMSSSSSWKEDS